MSVFSEMTMRLYPDASNLYGYKVEPGDDSLFIMFSYLEDDAVKSTISIPVEEIDAVVQALLLVKQHAEAENKAWEAAQQHAARPSTQQ